MASSDALERAAALYRAELSARGELAELDLTGYDRTGVPVVATTWEPRGGGPDAHGVGYGATRVEASVGALGELAERVVLGPVLQRLGREQRRRASYAELLAQVGEDGVADPLTLVLPAGSPYTADQPLDWVPAVRWRTGESVLVPAELAAFDGGILPPDPPPGGWLTTPVSNGLGAGDDLVRAVSHALLELVQRDGDTADFKALDAGAVLDLDAGPLDEETRAVVAQLRAAGVEPVVKLASDDLVPVVYCHGSAEDDATPPMAVGSVGEAAHPDGRLAVRKALLEFAASRARRVFAFGPLDAVRDLSPQYWAAESRRPVGEQEPRALEEMARWSRFDVAAARAAVEPAFSRRTRSVPLASLPVAADLDPPAVLELLLRRLAERLEPLGEGRAGGDVLVVASDDGPVRAAKVLVPTLEVETLSYARIGERVARRLLERDDALVGRGAPDRSAGPGRRAVRLTAAATERLGGPVWFDVEAAERAVGPLYSLYREPRRHAVARLGLA